MKWMLCLLVVGGCQRGTSEGESKPAAPGYAAEIGKLCDVMALSGADQLEGGDRTVISAQWLTKNTTDVVHEFLVKIQPLDGEAKASALEAEARRVGLAQCPLAAEWRRTPTR